MPPNEVIVPNDARLEELERIMNVELPMRFAELHSSLLVLRNPETLSTMVQDVAHMELLLDLLETLKNEFLSFLNLKHFDPDAQRRKNKLQRDFGYLLEKVEDHYEIIKSLKQTEENIIVDCLRETALEKLLKFIRQFRECYTSINSIILITNFPVQAEAEFASFRRNVEAYKKATTLQSPSMPEENTSIQQSVATSVDPASDAPEAVNSEVISIAKQESDTNDAIILDWESSAASSIKAKMKQPSVTMEMPNLHPRKPAYKKALYSRGFLSKALGGGQQSLNVNITESQTELARAHGITNLICPKLAINPEIPVRIGTSGNMNNGFGHDFEKYFKEPVERTLFSGIKNMRKAILGYQYMGQYRCTRMPSLPKEVWHSRPTETQEIYLRITAQKNPQYRPENPDSLTSARKAKDRVKKDFETGVLKIPCVKLEFIRYDTDFAADLYRLSQGTQSYEVTLHMDATNSPKHESALVRSGKKRKAARSCNSAEDKGASPSMDEAPTIRRSMRQRMRILERFYDYEDASSLTDLSADVYQ